MQYKGVKLSVGVNGGLGTACDGQAGAGAGRCDQGRVGVGKIVLDLFGGAGSTLITAHKTGWRGYLCEYVPLYSDRIIQRWDIYAKDEAELLPCS